MEKAILCVDDESIILDCIKSQLKRHYGNEFYLETASSADEALEIIEEMNEDGIKILVIVSDWLMPGIKGDEFLIKVHEAFPGIVKLMLTGQADTSSVENAKKNANLYACINKPWKEEELFSILDEAMKQQ